MLRRATALSFRSSPFQLSSAELQSPWVCSTQWLHTLPNLLVKAASTEKPERQIFPCWDYLVLEGGEEEPIGMPGLSA